MQRLRAKKGFTLVELSLSIAFIGILSITIVLIINNAIATYRRGLTLNQINTVGMDLVDDMRAALQNSPASFPGDCKNGEEWEVGCLEDYILAKRFATVEGVGENVPVAGAFCTGKYSYAWNSGYLFSGDADTVNKIGFSEYGDAFRLLKVEDKDRAVCSILNNDEGKNTIDLEIELGTAEALLADDTANALALYDLSVPVPAINDVGNAAFYSVSFILGTVQGGINVMSGGNFCKAPESYSSAENFDYCAINKFNFAAQANGG